MVYHVLQICCAGFVQLNVTVPVNGTLSVRVIGALVHVFPALSVARTYHTYVPLYMLFTVYAVPVVG
jgi:hypothetical protein